MLLKFEDESKMNNVVVKKSKIGQFEKGVFANKNFRKGDIVIEYNLKLLTKKEFENLSKKERNFVHNHYGKLFQYSSPEKYVNHNTNPNTIQDIKNKCDIALRSIKEGEEITTNSTKDDVPKLV